MTGKKEKENRYWKFAPQQQQQQKFIEKKYQGFCKAEEHRGRLFYKRNVSV
jgi:hypothetical protein